MSVRFAAARCAARSPIARVLRRGEIGRPANDTLESDVANRPLADVTKAALRHFAEHGMRAVSVAATNAATASAAHQPEDYRYWLEICRALDSGAARRIENGTAETDERLIG